MSSKKATQDISKNKNEGSWGGEITVVFYPLFLRLIIVPKPIFLFGNMDFQIQIGGKKLVDGGKKLLICKVWIFNFYLHKK